ncbi:hypothetical protein A5641_09035 [Mycobacterium sp. 1554424.7]|nr:hypothetical protein A5641_09035 [Mycobacterium sp. 1554424.7]
MNDLDGRALRVGLPAIAPLHQRDNGGQEIETLICKAVFVAFALTRFTVGNALHHPRFDQGVQPFAEQVAGTSHMGLELLEATRTIEGLP